MCRTSQCLCDSRSSATATADCNSNRQTHRRTDRQLSEPNSLLPGHTTAPLTTGGDSQSAVLLTWVCFFPSNPPKRLLVGEVEWVGLDVPSKHISGSCSAYRSLHTGTHVINYKKTFTSPSPHCHPSLHPSLPLTSPHPYFPLPLPRHLTFIPHPYLLLPLPSPSPHPTLTFTFTSPHFSPSPSPPCTPPSPPPTSPSPLPPLTSPPHLTSPHPSPLTHPSCTVLPLESLGCLGN